MREKESSIVLYSSVVDFFTLLRANALLIKTMLTCIRRVTIAHKTTNCIVAGSMWATRKVQTFIYVLNHKEI